MKNRKVPERPHWRSRCYDLEAFLETVGFRVTYSKQGASVDMTDRYTFAKPQPKASLFRRAWHRINWLVGS